MRVLVTGGTGFLGGVLVRQILDRTSWSVRLLVRSPEKCRGLDPLRLEAARGDLRDSASLRAAAEGVDLVFHLAVCTSDIWEECLEETVRGTERLVDASLEAGVRRFVHISSIWVSEEPAGGGTVDEGSPYRTTHLNEYTRSKILSEQVVRRAAAERDLDAVVARLGQLFGPGGPPLQVGYHVGSRFLVARPEDVPVPTLFVENAAASLLFLAERGEAGEVYQVVDDEPVVKSRYLQLLARRRSPRIFVVPFPTALLGPTAAVLKALSGVHPVLAALHRSVRKVTRRLEAGTAVRYCNRKVKALGWRQPVPTETALAVTLGTATSPSLEPVQAAA